MMYRTLIAICAFIFAGPTYCINYQLSPDNPVPGSVLVLEQNKTGVIQDCILKEDNTNETVMAGVALQDEFGKEVYIIPLSHTVKPGPYTLQMILNDGSLAELHVSVEDRTFVHEDIPLNSAMTTLRSTDSAKKRDESAELWDLLSTKNISLPYRKLSFIKPIEAVKETSFYGDRRTYIYNNDSKSNTYHNGIDYAAYTGTPVFAVESGQVVMAKKRVITGNSIVIEHAPGIFTLYYHLEGLDVEAGDVVSKGQKIGISGATGLATGPHLHFEMRVFQVPVDPELYMHGISPQGSFD